MGVRQSFGFGELRKRLNNVGVSNDVAILRRLQKIGEEMCSHAREDKGGHPIEYDDQTHNLRSSIGYRIYFNGEQKAEGGFQNVTGTNPKTKKEVTGDGKQEAENALNEFASAYVTDVSGWVIIIVCGMKYAKYVEAKGYNVLHLTNIKLQEEVNKLKREFGIK